MLLVLVVAQLFLLCNQRGAFWVQMYPVVRTEWNTTLNIVMFRHKTLFYNDYNINELGISLLLCIFIYIKYI